MGRKLGTIISRMMQPKQKRKCLEAIGATPLLLLAVIVTGCATNLYVDASAAAGGNGSKSTPFRTIHEAVTAAQAGTRIHVAEGTYNEPEMILARKCVRIEGSTILKRDSSGLPTDVNMSAANVRPAAASGIPMGEALLTIHAARVHVTGLRIDGQVGANASQGSLIRVDGAPGPADGFVIEDNVLLNAASGVTARLAAGTIRHNYIAKLSVGVLIFGWPLGSSPPTKRILVEGNRLTENGLNGALFIGSTGSSSSAFPSGPTGPGALRVEISRNDFRRNGTEASCPHRFPNTGLYFLVNDSLQDDPLQPANIDAIVRDNTFNENVFYGIAVGQRIQPMKRQVAYQFTGTFKNNQYCGNGLNAAMFDFTHVPVSHNSPVPFSFGRGSTYTIDATLDPLATIDFDYDHPALDPDAHNYDNPPGHENAGAPLGNTLVFNGTAKPNTLPANPHVKPCPPPPVIGNCPSPP